MGCDSDGREERSWLSSSAWLHRWHRTASGNGRAAALEQAASSDRTAKARWSACSRLDLSETTVRRPSTVMPVAIGDSVRCRLRRVLLAPWAVCLGMVCPH